MLRGTSGNAVTAAISGGAGGASTTFLASDQAITTGAFVDLANTGAIGAAGQVWLLIGTAAGIDTSASTNAWELGIFNGSVYVANMGSSLAASLRGSITIAAVVTLAAATTFTMRARSIVGNASVATTAAGTGVANKATSLTAVRLA